jgi:hypothetical protein
MTSRTWQRVMTPRYEDSGDLRATTRPVRGKERGRAMQQSLATGLLGIGLVITCLAGFRVMLFGVDLLTGVKHRSQLQPADVILLVIALVGLVMLIAGALLLHQITPAG